MTTTPDTTTGAQPDQAVSDAPEEAPTQQEEEHGVDYWKGMARKWEDTANRNAEAARQWDAYQQTQKTEEERAASERETLVKERDAARREARMTRAAVKHGLSEEDLSLLDPNGSDEEFEARAAALGERIASAKQTAPRLRDPNVGREFVNTPSGGDWLRQAITNS